MNVIQNKLLSSINVKNWCRLFTQHGASINEHSSPTFHSSIRVSLSVVKKPCSVSLSVRTSVCLSVPPTLWCLQWRFSAHYILTSPHHLLLKSYVPLVCPSVRLSVCPPPYYACSEGTIYTYKAVCVLVFPWVPPCVFVWLNCASPTTLICLQWRHSAHYIPTPPHHLLLKSYVPLVCPSVRLSVCPSVPPPIMLTVKVLCSLYTHPTPPPVVKKICSISERARRALKF